MSSILFSFMYWGVQQMNLKHLFYLLILLTSIIKRVEQLWASQIEHTSEHLTALAYPGFKASQYNIHWHESWRKDVMGSLRVTLWEGMYCKTLTPLASNRLSIDMQIREELVCGLLVQSLNISSEKKIVWLFLLHFCLQMHKNQNGCVFTQLLWKQMRPLLKNYAYDLKAEKFWSRFQTPSAEVHW